MTSGPKDGLHQALVRIAASEDAPIDVLDELRAVPVGLRAALVAAVLAGADRPLNGVVLAKAARFSRGTAYRTNKDALAAVIAAVPTIAASVLGQSRSGGTRSELSAALHSRDETIAKLRAEVKDAERDRDIALAYARDLHQQLEPEYRGIQAERSEKVRHLRGVESDQPTDADEPTNADD